MATDILTGGTVTSNYSGEGNDNSLACDGDPETSWYSDQFVAPHWWKYNLGEGVTKKVVSLTILPYTFNPEFPFPTVKAFTLSGSNDDASYDLLYTGLHDNDCDKETYNFSNIVAYRYYKLDFSNSYAGMGIINVAELEMFEADETDAPTVYFPLPMRY